MQDQIKAATELEERWATDPRWSGIERAYTAADVVRLRGSVPRDVGTARRGSERLWELLHNREYVPTLGALSGGQAVQMVRAGLEALYLSGWQVAGDANLAGEVYPDQSLYPANSGPALVRRINNALRRADEVEWSEGTSSREWMVPIVADAEAGFGGVLNAFELAKAYIDAGASGVHFEDQLSSAKKCGHMGGKVLVPTKQHVQTLNAARFASDVAETPTVIVARTDSLSADLLTSDIDPIDADFIEGERTAEGYYRVRSGMDAAIRRGLAFAPYADAIWCETSTPDPADAARFAEAIHAEYPGKLLVYNCSPSFNWKQHLNEKAIAGFQENLAAMGYRFQFITLAGFHSLNASMFELASRYAHLGMVAYVEHQEREFELESHGYTATRHQREVGAGYFDEVLQVLTGGTSSTLALDGSTELEQFVSA